MPSLLGSTASRAGSVLANGAMNVLTQQANYAVNSRSRLVIPDLGALMGLYARGFCNWSEVSPIVAMHGVDMGYANWEQVIQSMYTYPSSQEALNAFYRGQIQSPKLVEWIEHEGWIGNAEKHWLLNKPMLWPAEQVRRLKAIGHIDGPTRENMFRAAGLLLREDRTIFEQLFNVPTVDQIWKMYQRNIIDHNTALKWVNLAGVNEPNVRLATEKYALNLPSASDLTDFAVKEVWNREVVQKFGYDDEFDTIPEYRYWMDRLGMSGDPNIPGSQPGGPANWAQAHWRSHWRNVAPDQAFRMLHRFRATGGPNGGPRVPFVPGTTSPVGSFTIEDVQTLLKVNDYPPFWRNKLAALSYNVLRLVDIRRIARLALSDPAFKQNAIGPGYTIKDWCKENYMDRGQTPQDAESLAVFTIYEAEQANSAQSRLVSRQLKARRKRLTEAQYRIGVISASDALAKLADIGYDTAQATELMSIIDEERKLKCSLDLMNSVRGPLMKGKMTETDARTRLTAAGLEQTFVGFWVDCWKGLLTDDAAREATDDIVRQYVAGTITREKAIEQMEALGWVDPEDLLEVLASE